MEDERISAIIYSVLMDVRDTLKLPIHSTLERTFIYSAILTVVSIFLTLICDTGGNSGSQSSTLMIRGLSTGDFELKDYWKIMDGV